MQGCDNELCPGRGQALSATTGFSLLVDLTDHTGTLHTCSLRSPVAEKTLGCSVSTALQKDDDSASIIHVVVIKNKSIREINAGTH